MNNRLYPQESLAFSYLREAAPFPVSDNAGGLVRTDHRMAVYKFWFETQMNLHSQITTFSLARSGAKIEGMPYTEVAQALALPVVRDKIENKKEIMRGCLGKTSGAEQLSSVKRGLADLIPQLEKLTEKATEGVRAAQEAITRLKNKTDPTAALRRLSEVDQSMAGMLARDVAGFLAGHLVQKINASSERTTDQGTWLAYSLTLYAELERSGHFHLKHLKKSYALL
jgi:hypothetical protein